MIETHTVNALLFTVEGGGTFRTALTFLNGLVAPAFLFCAGLGFAIALWRRAADGPPGREFAVSIGKKCIFIMVLGYSMHTPVFSLRGLLDSPPEVRAGFFTVDILQVIALSLLVLLAMMLPVRKHRGRIVAAGAFGSLVIAAGAVAGGTTVFAGWADTVPVWIGAYFSRGMSLFTIVPWAAHVAAGFVLGSIYVHRAEENDDVRVIKGITLTAGGVLVLAITLAFRTAHSWPGGSFWYWSPEYVVVRMAAVVLIMCAVWRTVRGGMGPAGRALELFGRVSLPVYYWHLIIVYGKDFEWSFVRLFPGGTGAVACVSLLIGLIALMYLFALGWSSGKKRYPRAAGWIVRGLVAGSVVTFVVS